MSRTFNNVIIAPYELSNLLELAIIKRLNDHARLSFTGIIPADKKDSYVKDTEAQTVVEVSQVDEDGQVTALFKGIVAQIKVRKVGDTYTLHVEAVSISYILDVQIKDRSFQNIDQTYTDLIYQVLEGYSGAQVNDTVTDGAKTGQLIVQYQETDWQFLNRLASRFHAPIIPTSIFLEAKFYFGPSDQVKKNPLENVQYSICKKLGDFRTITGNADPDLQETDFIEYDVESPQPFELGDNVSFGGQSLYIREVKSVLQGDVVRHNYRLTPKGGLSRKEIPNPRLSGTSLSGQVLAVEKDKVRVKLAIDAVQNAAEAYWFPYTSSYTAEGYSGWYCMPEVDDTVRIFFPDPREENAVALASVRQDTEGSATNQVGDPDIKYFRTKSGKVLKFAPGEILLSAKDGSIFIRLNDEDGIEIQSAKGIQLGAKDDLTIVSQKNVSINAAKELSVTCKGSSILLDGQATIKGSKVKSN